MKRIRAYAPASIGNVSLGFDVLGAALAPVDGTLLGDEVEVYTAPCYELKVEGWFADKLPAATSENIVTRCYRYFISKMKEAHKPVSEVAITLYKNLPVGSGLGSSASSIVAAFYGLNQYFDEPFDRNTLLLMMGELEGEISGSVHYDNVAPCYFGGMTLMSGQDSPIAVNLPVFGNWYWVICYSGASVSTAAARKVIPQAVPLADTITFGRQLGVFVHALYSDNHTLAASVIKDVIAEPHRQALLPGFDAAQQVCAENSTLAFGISGSGPTVFAVCDSQQQAEKVAAGLTANYIQNEEGFCHICRIPSEGASEQQVTEGQQI